jgi:hypothetical protein
LFAPTAQVGACRAAGDRAHRLAGAGEGLVARDGIDDVLNGREALLLQLFGLQHRDGQRRLGVDAANGRTGDFNALQRGLLRKGCLRCDQRRGAP